MSDTVSAVCPQCRTIFYTVGRINRARKIGAPVYCGRACSGLARRRKIPLTDAEAKEAKRLYDMGYRRKNSALLKAKKRAYFERTYDPVQAAIKRKENMPNHVEYCRRPEYVAWKSQYDREYRATKQFGEFGEAFLLLQNIEQEISERASRYDVYMTNGTINKAQLRKRAIQ